MLYTKSIKYPDTFDLTSGRTQLDDNIISINRCIGLLLTTGKGELLGDPDFGCRLYEMLFDQYSEHTQELIKQEIVDSITQFETRVKVTTNDVTITEHSNGSRNSYQIKIHYVVNNSSQENITEITMEERDINE